VSRYAKASSSAQALSRTSLLSDAQPVGDKLDWELVAALAGAIATVMGSQDGVSSTTRSYGRAVR
jgi:hypothetical protein